jgi:hypothetical protein
LSGPRGAKKPPWPRISSIATPSSSGRGRDADRDVVKGFNEFFARHTIMHNTNLMTFAVGERAAISIRRGERRG